MKIKRVIYNDPATVVLFDDGTKTVAKATDGDVYDRNTGLAICLAKKLLGSGWHEQVYPYLSAEHEQKRRVKLDKHGYFNLAKYDAFKKVFSDGRLAVRFENGFQFLRFLRLLYWAKFIDYDKFNDQYCKVIDTEKERINAACKEGSFIGFDKTGDFVFECDEHGDFEFTEYRNIEPILDEFNKLV